MASNYSPELRIQLMQTGEKSGQWGDITNVNWELIESSVSGSVNLSLNAGNNKLTYADGSADQSRSAILNITSAGGVFVLFAPPVTKTYIIKNNTASAGTIYCSTVIGNEIAAGAGYSIPANSTVFIHSDGQQFYDGVNHIFGPLKLDTALGSNYGGTGYGTLASPYVVGDILYANTTSSLAKIAISGTANRVLRSNGTIPSWGQVALTTDVTGVLPVANGGTNLSTIPQYSTLVANTANTLTALTVTGGQSIRLNSGGTAWEAYTPATGSGSVSSITAGTGLSGGTITSSGTIAIANTGVTANTYGNSTTVPQITVNAQGQITGVTNIAISGSGVTSISANSPLSASSSTGSVSLSIANASGSAAGVVTTGTQTFAGTKTFDTGIISSNGYNFTSNSSLFWNGVEAQIRIAANMRFFVGNGSAGFDLSDVQKVGGGTFNSYSDARYKQEITSYAKGLAEISQLQPRSYRYTAEFMKSDSPSQVFVGVVAQELESTAFATCVKDDANGYKVVDTSELTYALINAVKELSARVEQLEAQLAAM